MFASVKHVGVKIAQGSLQKIITWTKKIKKRENTCVGNGLWLWKLQTFVATLPLGSRPRQGLAKVRAKSARECEGMKPHTLK